MKKEIIAKIMSHLFSALLTVSLFFVLIASSLSATVLNKNYVFYTLDRTDYAQHLYTDIVSKLKPLSAASGVEESFFETAVDVEQVRTDAMEYVNVAIAGGNTAEYRKTVRENFDKQMVAKLIDYAEGQGFEISETVDEALSHLSSVCSDYYAKFIAGTIMGTLFSVLGTVSEKLLIPALCGVLVLLAVAVIAFIYARRFDGQNITKSLIATGITTSIIPLAVLFSRLIQRLGIEGAAMKAFFAQYIGAFVILLAIEAVLMFALAGLNYYLNIKKGSAK